MTITVEQKTYLDSLHLKENSELYQLAVLLLAAPNSNRRSQGIDRVIPWNAAVDSLCTLAQKPPTHAEYTPLSLFMKIAHLIQNPVGLLSAILLKAEGNTKPRTRGFDVGLYDGKAILILVGKLGAGDSEHRLAPTLLVTLCKSTDYLQIQKMFAPFAHLDNHNFLILLENLCADSSDFTTVLIQHLLQCQPTIQLNDPLLLPHGSVFSDAPKPSNLCELAIYHPNLATLKLLIPRTDLSNRFQALKYVLTLSSEYIHKIDGQSFIECILENTAGIVEKIATEGQDLLYLYVQHAQKYETKHPKDPKSTVLNDKILSLLLNTGCMYDPRIAAYPNTSNTIIHTNVFFKKLSAWDTSKILDNLHRLDLYYNARCYNDGNTIFNSLFHTLMQENPIHFNALLTLYLSHSEETNTINISLRNREGYTVLDLPYLNKEQRNCLIIAEKIKNAQVLRAKIHAKETTRKETMEFTAALQSKIQDISCCIEQLPQYHESVFVLYFSILHLYTAYTETSELILTKTTSLLWIDRITQFIGNTKGPCLFRVLNDCLRYMFFEETAKFSQALYKAYERIVKTILFQLEQQPEILKFTQEQFTSTHLENPFKILLRFPKKNILPMIKILLESEISPDVIINAKGDSLLYALIAFNDRSTTWQQTIDLLFTKIKQCPFTLTLANLQGNTPLHAAFIFNFPLKQFAQLVNTLQSIQADMNVLNKDGFTPFYCAIQKSRINIAKNMLKSMNPSVMLKVQSLVKNTNTTPGSSATILVTDTALTLWRTCTNLKLPAIHLSTENLALHRYQVSISLQFAILLLEKGCHFFPPKQVQNHKELIQLQNSIAQYQKNTESLWDGNNPNPFPSFTAKIYDLISAWDIIEELEQGTLSSYATLKPFLFFFNTRRFSDDKTMLEILVNTQKKLKATLSTTLDLSLEDPAMQLATQQIAQINEIISCMLLEGVQDQSVLTDDNHLLCAELAKKIVILKENHNKWLKTKDNPIAETKEHTETLTLDIETLTTIGEEIFETLKSLDLPQEYILFKGLCYFESARCLFRMDKMDNTQKRLFISQKTLLLANKLLQAALSISRSFSSKNLVFRNDMVGLNTIIAPCIPDANGMHKLKSILEILIPHASEVAARQKDDCTFEQVDDLLGVYGGGKFSCSNSNLYNNVPSLCTAIPEALERGEKLIDSLKEDLEKTKAEALAKELLLQEEIRKLKQQILVAQDANVNSKKRSETLEEDNASEKTSEKRQKTMP